MSKKWYFSKTIIGAVVAIIASLLDQYGFHFSAGDKDATTELILKILEVAGAAFAIFGRVTANAKITR